MISESDQCSQDPLEGLVVEEICQWMEANLSAGEFQVMDLLYRKELNAAEAGAELGKSQREIETIHARAICRLRSHFRLNAF